MKRGLGFSLAPGNTPIDPSSTTPYVISRRDRTRRDGTGQFSTSLLFAAQDTTEMCLERRSDAARDWFHTRRNYEGIRPERRWMCSVQQLLDCIREGTTHEKESLDSRRGESHARGRRLCGGHARCVDCPHERAAAARVDH